MVVMALMTVKYCKPGARRVEKNNNCKNKQMKNYSEKDRVAVSH